MESKANMHKRAWENICLELSNLNPSWMFLDSSEDGVSVFVSAMKGLHERALSAEAKLEAAEASKYEFEITSEMYDAAWSAFGATPMEDLHKKLSIHDVRRLFKMFVDAINSKI